MDAQFEAYFLIRLTARRKVQNTSLLWAQRFYCWNEGHITQI